MIRCGASQRALLALVLLLLGVSACKDAQPESSPPLPGPMRNLVNQAPVILLGQVEDLSPGRVAGPPEDQLLFQNVRIGVDRLLKGRGVGESIVVEQVDPSGRVVLGVRTYSQEERYVLFVRPSESEGGIHVVLRQGRYLVEGETVRSTEPGPVANQVNGMQLDDFLAEVARHVGSEAASATGLEA